MRNLLLATAAISLFAVPAVAQTVSSPQVSGSVGYTVLDGDDVNLGALTGRLTARVHPNFAVEGEASIGVKDDDITVAGVNGSVEHDYDAAAYAVGILPISPNVELFGRVGYGTTKLKAEVAGVSASDSEESVNYGVGANYFLDGQNGVRADWTRRDFRNGGGEADVWSLNFVRKF